MDEKLAEQERVKTIRLQVKHVRPVESKDDQVRGKTSDTSREQRRPYYS